MGQERVRDGGSRGEGELLTIELCERWHKRDTPVWCECGDWWLKPMGNP